MTPIETKRGDELVKLARERFDPELREVEERVLRHSCGYEDPPDWSGTEEGSIGPSGRPLAGWDGPELRPGLLRWVLTDGEAQALLEPRGLRVWGVRISESLDLSSCRADVRLELRYCLVERSVQLALAKLRSLSLQHCTLESWIDGTFLTLTGWWRFDMVSVVGMVYLDGMKIEGEMRLMDTELSATGRSLSMTAASVGNDLLLFPGLRALGTLSLQRVHVGGALSLEGAELSSSATALDLEDSKIGGALSLQGAEVSGEIRLLEAAIGGQLDLSAARLTTTETALTGDGMKVSGGAFFHKGFECAGEIRLLRAAIGAAWTAAKQG